jgi:hypothetical protein
MRHELLRRLTTIPGVSIPDDRIDRYPSFELARLADADARSTFTDAMDWAIREAAAAANA